MKSTEGIVVAIFAGSALSLLTWMSDARSNKVDKRLLQENLNFLLLPDDTTKDKKNEKYKPSTRPTYKPKDRYGDPTSNKPSRSPLLLKDPSNINQKVDLGDDGKSFEIQEKVGNVDYRPPTRMNYKQYTKLRNQEMIQNYWKTTSAGKEAETATGTKSLIPKIYLSPILDRIFGGNTIDVKPNGTIMLDFGGRYQRTDNPSIPVQQQRVGQFWFDQQIAFNIQAKIGERLTLRANWDTKATFDFDNNIKLQYKAQEEDIIQNVEAGNINMAGTNLIQGEQNLFGVKTYLRFGKLWVTSAVGNERGKSGEVVIPGGAGGAISKQSELRADNYQDNQHYFLSQYFRNIYEQSLNTLPYVKSGINVTRVEVYVTNRNNNTSTLRDIVAFTDLGENHPMDSLREAVSSAGGPYASNFANSLYNKVKNDPAVRNSTQTQTQLTNTYQYVQGTNFEVVRGARKLTENVDYIVNKQLGYISLTSPLRNDDVLAVSYQYSYEGTPYTVGELSETYQLLPSGENAIFKLLRPTIINTSLPLWNLQMKNVYSLGTTNISKKNFQLRVIWKDDYSGIDNPSLQTGVNRTLNNQNLVAVLGADKLNLNGDPQPSGDGSFDFVSGVTVDTANGRIMFPVLEPFGAYLDSKFNQNTDVDLINKYCFFELYRKTKSDASQVTQKNKYFLKYTTQSSSSGSEIQLPGMNIAENSVVVTAGSRILTPGTDYTVNYQTGRVNIINAGVLSSGSEIRIRYEQADLFNFRTKTFLGSRFEYRWNKHLNVGATIYSLNERPLIQRVSLGDEPIDNMMWGMDFSYKNDSRLITKLVDYLPLISTKAPSSISASGEVAQILPLANPFIKGNGLSFIDDFEGQETPYDLTRPATKWVLGSVPEDPNLGLRANISGLGINFNRALLAWYNIDNVFFQTSGTNRPTNISTEDMKYHYIRPVSPQEIYPNRSQTAGIAFEQTFDMAFYPNERGPYNYAVNTLNHDGTLKNPQSNFASISRGITTNTDFDAANIQYLEFWLMDPFIQGEYGKVLDGTYNTNNSTGGKLIFQLGSISEDVVADAQLGFENGLPTDQGQKSVGTIQTPFGLVTTQTYNTNPTGFANIPGARSVQDVGFDGLRSNGASEEADFFQSSYISKLSGRVDPTVIDQISADPSNDDFHYYLGSDLNSDPTMKILKRYKRYNGTENNSPENTGGASYNPSSYQTPDNEDINSNNTLDQLEQYYQYNITLRPGMQEASKYIVSTVNASAHDLNGNAYDNVNWYQVRIPLRDNPQIVNGISGFKSIRFVRTLLTGFSQPVVLRMAQFQFVGSTWRIVPDSVDLLDKGQFLGPPEPSLAYVSTVNIEENGQNAGQGIPYVIPPRGLSRDRDNTSTLPRLLNEQSLRLTVNDLRERDARAAFKTVLSLNLINYTYIDMFVHAHGPLLKTNEQQLTMIFRIGTDLVQNYYEVEVPLVVTPSNTVDPNLIWPSQNDMSVAIADLTSVKVERNNYPGGFSLYKVYSTVRGGRTINVVGNPDLTSVQVLGIGVKNPPKQGDGAAQSVVLWADELRVSGYNEKIGTAALGRVDAKLADLGTLSASTRYVGVGFGSMEQIVSQRSTTETFGFSVASNISLDKFTPARWGLRLPMYVSYDNTTITPEYDPLNPDVKLANSLASISDANARALYAKLVIDNNVSRSINFTNVQKMRMGKRVPLPFDIENFNFSFAYSDQNHTNVSIAQYLQLNYKGGIGYNYSLPAKSITPFKFIKSKYLKLLSDFNFNPAPSGIVVRMDLNRLFNKTQLRTTGGNASQTGIYIPGASLTTEGIAPIYTKTFNMTRTYAFQWAIAKSLMYNYSANVLAIIDEPYGDINGESAGTSSGRSKQDSVLYNLEHFGRTQNFTQNMGLDYNLPLDKFPLTDFMSATARYSTGIIWTSGPMGIRDSLGNTLQNTRTQALNGKVDLLKLYNKIPFLKHINNPVPPAPKIQEVGPDGKKKPDEKPVPQFTFIKEVLRAIMRWNTFNGSYSLTEGTMIPGFLKTPSLLGFDSEFSAPGLPFMLGSQDRNQLVGQFEGHSWLSKNAFINTPLTQQRSETMTFKTSWEIIKTLVVQVDFRRTSIANYQENIRYNDSLGYQSQNPQRSGSYTLSYNTFLTAFQFDNPITNLNTTFNNFQAYRHVIHNRLTNNPNDTTSYSLNSQDVLIPAFLAAYSGQDPSKQALNAFPKIPLPNWRIDYSGLANLGFMKRYFTSFTLTHSYSNTYAVNSYSSSLQYGDKFVSLNNREWSTQAPNVADTSTHHLVPVYIINMVTITEQFGPLAGVNFRTKKNLTGKLEYRQGRNLALNISNAQVTEQETKGFVAGFGFSKSNLKLPFRISGRDIVLKNEVVFRFDFSYQDSKTVQRQLADSNTGVQGLQIVTQGTTTYQIKPNISYQASKRLNLQLYYDHQITVPHVSNSFLRVNIAFGIQLRFSLS